MKKLCELLREPPIKIINWKKIMKTLTKEQQKPHVKMQQSVIFVKEKLKVNIWKIKNIVKLGIIDVIQGNIEVLRIACVI